MIILEDINVVLFLDKYLQMEQVILWRPPTWKINTSFNILHSKPASYYHIPGNNLHLKTFQEIHDLNHINIPFNILDIKIKGEIYCSFSYNGNSNSQNFNPHQELQIFCKFRNEFLNKPLEKQSITIRRISLWSNFNQIVI